MKNTVKRYAFVELIGRTRCLFTETWQPGASTVCKETWDSSFILSPTIMVEIREIWCKMMSCIFVPGSNNSNRSWDTGCVVSWVFIGFKQASYSVRSTLVEIWFFVLEFKRVYFLSVLLENAYSRPFGGFGCLVPKWEQHQGNQKRHTYGT